MRDSDSLRPSREPEEARLKALEKKVDDAERRVLNVEKKPEDLR